MESRRGGGGGRKRRRTTVFSSSSVTAFLCLSLLASSSAASLFSGASNGFSRPAERAKSPLSPLLADQRRSSRSVSLSTQGKPTSGPARPGSYPPRCTSKCGECTPCSPVHVAVPPGTPVTTEYYPEAWRCKCGNRFFMP